jgi:sRNA-binding protein
VLQILQERWPNCFSIYERNRRPLKLLIHLEILRALDGAVTEPELINALRCYVGNREYLKKIKVGADRVDLDGNVVGKVIESEELHARKNLGGQYNPPEPAWSRAWRFENEREAWKKIKKEYEKRIRSELARGRCPEARVK